MPKEKITLTLEAGRLAELRSRVGSRSVSAAVDAALVAYLEQLRHGAAVDEWLAELERDHGPVPVETWSGPPGWSRTGRKPAPRDVASWSADAAAGQRGPVGDGPRPGVIGCGR